MKVSSLVDCAEPRKAGAGESFEGEAVLGRRSEDPPWSFDVASPLGMLGAMMFAIALVLMG